MEWLNSLFIEHSALQAVIVLAVIISLGLGIGKIRICGISLGMTPMALNYANDTLPGDNPAVSYATVYPLCMFCRVIIAQLVLMFFM